MIRALDSGDGLCFFMHNLISLLLTASRPDVRALGREADPVAGWRVTPQRRTRAADGARSVGDERRPHAPWAPRYRSAPSRDPRVPGGAIRMAVKIVREIREQIGSAAGSRKVMTENAPAFAQWHPASLSTCSCDPGRVILCLISLPLRPLHWP